MNWRVFAGLVLLTGAGLACACVPDLGAGKGAKPQIIDAKHYAVAWRTLPDKIVIGQHFVVELSVCAKDGAAAPHSVRVDAHMPEHRHGMNYKTAVTSSGAGKYRAEGLMFHMPGRWEYIFEVRAGADGGVANVTERMTTSVVLQ